MGLGVLRMRPAEAEVLGLDEVGAAFFTGLVVGEVHGKVSVKLVIDFVSGVYIGRPGAQRIIAAGEGKVEIIPDDEIHTHIAGKEAAGLFLTKGGHQEAGGTGGFLGHEAKGQADGDGDIGNHRMRRAEHRFLRRLGDNLGHTQLQVIVRMLQVAHRVHAIPHIDGLVRHHLDFLALQDAFRLPGDHIGDASLLRIEIIAEFVHLVRLAAFRHFRQTFHLAGDEVFPPRGKDGVGFHIILDIIGRKLHILVGDRSTAIIVNHPLPITEVRYDGVFGRRKSRTFQGTFVQDIQGIPLGGSQGIGPLEGIPGGGLQGIRVGNWYGVR